MNYTPFGYDDTYQPELPDRWERTPSYAPTSGYLDRQYTPSVVCERPYRVLVICPRVKQLVIREH
jgi:hypothetical protein